MVLERAPVSITLTRLEVSLRRGPSSRQIVSPLSFSIDGGTLFGILGGSGSGKTTLLNVLANRYDGASFKVPDNCVTFGGYSNPRVVYVTQFDTLIPFLTVREILVFAAQLKLPSSENYEQVVEGIILDLGLKEVADSRIGETGVVGGLRGLSGGEKRRLSVGLQIISDPEVLCGDEITSGLDSFTAVNLIETIKRLTLGPRRTTAIVSLHQPRADIFHQLDSVLLLSRGGGAVYCGPAKDMVQYFSNLFFHCPYDANPADFFTDLAGIDFSSPSAERESLERLRRLQDACRTHLEKEAALSVPQTHTLSCCTSPGQHALPLAEGKEGKVPHFRAPWLLQVWTLSKRVLLNTYRDTNNVAGGLLQAGFLGITIMAIFWQLDSSPAGIRSRSGLNYIAVSAEPYIFLIILVERYCREVKVFDRELQDGLYSPSAYMLSNVIGMTPQLLIQPLVFVFPIYYGTSLRPGDLHVFTFVSLLILLGYLISGLAWWCVSMDRSFSVASLIANSQFTFIALTSSFLVNAADIPIYVSWVKFISYLSYSYRLLMSNELTDASFTSCSAGYCMTVQGNDVLKAQKLSPNDFTEPWVVLFSMAVAYHLLALLSFHLIKRPPTGSVGGDGEEEGEEDLGDLGIFTTVAGEEGDVELASTAAPTPAVKDGDPEIDEPPKVVVTVKGISLSVVVQGGEKRILQDVSAVFRPGRVCALMGGSGSGKTSLLDLVARRSRNIKKTGSILFNGAAASDAAVRQMVGYVQQNDYHLPSLTVRETLLFNANLLMPESVSNEQKTRRVEKLISLLGLRLCANTRVGGEEIKGVSGGEKRRLSVGCQLILDPSCALLDEVTTGLDAFSARSVVQTLRDLSRRGDGRTVILSIHQPRYDVFSLCDDVVLLSQGRCVWSGAREEMLLFLARQGCPCPSLSNPADHALDVSSIDLRSADKEAESRERVERLIAAFAALKVVQSGTVQADDGGVWPCVAEEEAAPAAAADEDEGGLALVPDKPLYRVLPLVLWRSFLNQARNPVLVSTRISQSCFFALILSCFYAPLSSGQSGIQSRIGLLYMLCSLCFIGMLNNIAVYPVERGVFYREYQDGGITVTAFWLSYYILAIPFVVLSAVLLSALVSYAIGIAPSAVGFLTITYVAFCFMLVGEACGVAFFSVFLHAGFAVNVVSVFISVFCMAAGFISIKQSGVVNSINYISPLQYGAWILTNTVFRDTTFSCTAAELSTPGGCMKTGREVLELYEMWTGDQQTQVLILGLLTLGFVLISWGFLRFRAWTLPISLTY